MAFTCATGVVHVGLVWSGLASAGVELCHEFAVGAAGSGEVLVALFELVAEIDYCLFEFGDSRGELVVAGGSAQSGFAPGSMAEPLG